MNVALGRSCIMLAVLANLMWILSKLPDRAVIWTFPLAIAAAAGARCIGTTLFPDKD